MVTALIVTGSIILVIIGFFLIMFSSFKKKMSNYNPEDDSKKLHKVDDKNFHLKIKVGVTLVDFWAPWCQPCLILGPIVSELAEEIGDNVKIAKLNIDDNQKTAAKYNVRSIPTIIIFKSGKEVQRIVGVKPKHFLKKTVEKYL